MRMPAVLKECDEVRDFLMEFLDRKLRASDALVFRLHLLLCPPCKKYMGRYKSSVELARNILDDPPPTELVNLTNEFLAKRSKEKK
ncbi:MAG: hypothetical protein FVQ81_18380 [Candidatus Glassbacteria bacterium]|nr:hypothetical protein [Candidatus Glassbacteria bacterium]